MIEEAKAVAQRLRKNGAYCELLEIQAADTIDALVQALEQEQRDYKSKCSELVLVHTALDAANRNLGAECTANKMLRAEVERLKQEQAEPVGEVAPRPDVVDWYSYEPEIGTKLYTHPAPKQEQAEPVYFVEDDFGLFKITDKADYAYWSSTGRHKTFIANQQPKAAPKQEQAEPVATLWREKNQKLYPGPSWKLTPAGEALPLGVEHHLYTAPQGQTALLRQALDVMNYVKGNAHLFPSDKGQLAWAIESIKQHLGEA